MKKKLLYVAPHLSTGGLPQYLYKKIELLINDYDIYVIEWVNHTGGVLVVQRNRITGILSPENFFTLGEDKKEILEIIGRINPDIIHVEEMPEYFMDYEIAKEIYTENRSYKIFESSHDSSFDTRNKRFFPDKLLLVSNYQIEMLKDLGVPCVLAEYPIEFKSRPNREEALSSLGLDPEYKHVINVGLFTPRKNQAEVFQYARVLKDYKIKFHFIGNQADNFKYYWEPLIKNKPDNCVVWGERSDVHKFYEAADLFLFTSRGSHQDKETSPLVIREAIGHQIPSLIYNLDVYMGMYDKYSNINYLSMSGENEDRILEVLGIEKIGQEEEIKQVRKIPIQDEWKGDENKIIFRYTNETTEAYQISVKDIDSKACIFSSELPAAKGGYEWWMIPLPKHVIDFQNDASFGGFLIEFRNSSGELVDVRKNRIKPISVVKPSMNITNTEPIFMNYEEFFVEGVYEHLDLKNPKNVLDIGANVGLWTKYILSKGANKVFCFEPNKEAVNHLRNTLRDNSNTFIFDKAVYKENTSLEFFVDESNSITSSIYSIQGHVPSYKVDAITLEDAINQTGENFIDLIKIDIEGAEFDIIENLSIETSSRVENFLIEYHDFLFPDGQEKVNKLEEKLRALGFYVTHPILPKAKYIYASRKKSLPLWINFNSEANKLELTYQGRIEAGNSISIKDIDSRSCIYSFDLPQGDTGFRYWAMPLSKDFYSFGNFYEFGGFLIELYDNEENLIESRKIRLKQIPIHKPVLDITKKEPTFLNYNEFFVLKLYDQIDVDNLGVVLDIGANIGLWTKYIKSRKAESVYCFEPNKKALKSLISAFKDDASVIICDKAVSGQRGNLEFYFDEGNSTSSSLLDVYDKNSSSYQVEAITLEDALNSTGRNFVDLVKIDIEGAEFDVLENASLETISRVHSFLIEFHSFYFENGEEKESNLISKLTNAGYSIQRIENFLYAKKVKKNYWVPKGESEEITNLYDFSRTFSWEKYKDKSQTAFQYMFNQIYFTNDYYTNGCIYERYGCVVQKGDVVLDAGANIGVFSNYAWEKGASQVYAFEPGMDAFKCLIKNKPPQSTIFNAALGSSNSIAKLSINTYENMGGAPMYLDPMSGSIYNQTDRFNYVPMVTIDSLFDSGVLTKIDFLKINCEGSEKEILNGISDLNLTKIRKISLEFHGNILNESDSEQIMNRLTSMGFRSFQLFVGDGVYRIYNFWKS
jgi:FkbM family methyltransferase